jgi:hypothetical protein
MRIAIIGSAGRRRILRRAAYTRRSGCDVHRPGCALGAMRENGLVIESEHAPICLPKVNATDDPRTGTNAAHDFRRIPRPPFAAWHCWRRRRAAASMQRSATTSAVRFGKIRLSGGTFGQHHQRTTSLGPDSQPPADTPVPSRSDARNCRGRPCTGRRVAAGLCRAMAPFIDALPADMTSSMHHDLEQGQPRELRWLSGGVVEMGAALGVSTPANRSVYDILVLHADGRGESVRR